MVLHYKVEKEKYENHNDYERRKLFIKSINPSTKNELNETVVISLAMNNIYNLKCKYHTAFQIKVEKAIKNIL
jgi:hypothetical protein